MSVIVHAPPRTQRPGGVKKQARQPGRLRRVVQQAATKVVVQIAGFFKLKFGVSKDNSKLTHGEVQIATFGLPSGYTCPTAKICLSRADRETGRITDGPHTQVRCHEASGEAYKRDMRLNRWLNLERLKACRNPGEMAELLHRSLPVQPYIRVNVSGDFFKESYLLAWVEVARRNPAQVFYGYTKRIALLVKHRASFPANLRLVASFGGTEDDLILPHKLKYARIVFSQEEADRLGLAVDHDDSHAYDEDQTPFALMLHGQQPKGSAAAAAAKILKAQGEYGYSKARKQAS